MKQQIEQSQFDLFCIGIGVLPPYASDGFGALMSLRALLSSDASLQLLPVSGWPLSSRKIRR
jgi:hypothetical protein